MSVRTDLTGKLQQLYALVLQFLLPIYLLVAPFSTRSATFFLIIVALAALPLVLSDGPWHLPWSSIKFHVAWLPVALWFALTPLWAEDPAKAFERVVSIAGLAIIAAVALWPARRHRLALHLPKLALAGAIAAAGLLLIVMQKPTLAGKTSVSDFNRCAISFAVAYWILLTRLRSPLAAAEKYLLIAALCACAGAVLLSDTQSAMTGLIVGHAAMLLALVVPQTAFYVLSASTVALTLLIRPIIGVLSMPLFQPVLDSSFMMRASGGVRLNIWQDYLAMADDRFWHGYGPGTAPSLEIKQHLVAAKGGAHESFLNFIHPHNAFVQIWFDMGAIGAIAASLGLAALFVVLRKPLVTHPALLGLTACIIMITTVSHGLYQTWWWALVALSAIYSCILKCD